VNSKPQFASPDFEDDQEEDDDKGGEIAFEEIVRGRRSSTRFLILK
jgi:hypothetical protein